jgi:hypothetical protein
MANKPHIEDLFTALNQHQNALRRIVHSARIRDQPEFARQEQNKLREKFREWGIEDAFDYEVRS